jgi:acetyl esterase/lipase
MQRSLFFLISAFIAASAHAQIYSIHRAEFKTQLLREGPAPQSYVEERRPALVDAIEYPSGNLKLNEWLAFPSGKEGPFAAVIFLHGGFSFSIADYAQARPFLDAGYAVMFPFLRGENGNPGNFELLYGEFDDALAAAQWLSTQPRIDAAKLAFFGHSVGGALAELTSLWNATPVVLSGSVGSLYPPTVFQSWRDFAPFDVADQQEVALRTFILNLPSMRRRHFAYLGNQEPQAKFLPEYRELAAKHAAPLSVTVVPGDHETSVKPAIDAFLGELKKVYK